MSEVFQAISGLRRSLDYHLQRHNVLASNVANIDTPGFRPAELLRSEDMKVERVITLSRSDAGHLAGAGATASGTDEYIVREDESVAGGADGNSVSLEREMSKLAANDLRYQGVAQLITKQIGILRYAANDGNG